MDDWGQRSCRGPAGRHLLILDDPGAAEKVTGGDPSRLRTAARRRAKAGQEARSEERPTAELRSEKSLGPHSRKAHLSLRPVWLGLAIIVLAVVVLMPTPDRLSVAGT